MPNLFFRTQACLTTFDTKFVCAGVLLAPVLSEISDMPSFLLVLDAKSFKEIGRAITPCDVKIPLTFHGSFIPHDHPSTKSNK